MTRSGGRRIECSDVPELLTLHVYGLVEGKERADLLGHLATCPSCDAQWRETRDVLGAVDAAAAFPREGEVDWRRFARDTAARARDLGGGSAARTAAGPARRRSRQAFLWGGLVAAAALLVILAPWPRHVPDGGAPGGAGREPVASPREGGEAARYLQESVTRLGAARYLRDSRSLLVDLVQAPTRCRRADGSLDVALEKTRSEDLLRRKNLYLRGLTGPRDQRLSDLMRQLETLLLQVSALDDCAAARQIHDLREAIERRQILLRIDLISREVEEGAARA